MQLRLVVAALAVVLLGFASVAEAQRGGGFGRGGGGMVALLRIEAVQQELDLTEDQIAQIEEVLQELRGNRGDRGGRRRGGAEGERGNRRRPPADADTRLGAADGTQFVALLQQEEEQDDRRARFQQAREEAEARQQEALAKIEKILKPAQLKRLKGIYIQVAGVAALNDPVIAKDLGITDDQREKMTEVRTEAFAGIRELFQGGDRDAIREKMAEVREKVEKDTLAVLTESQKKTWEEMKGEKFELPDDALRGGGRFGGGRPGGDRPAGGRPGAGARPE